jgi:hypothetical protein
MRCILERDFFEPTIRISPDDLPGSIERPSFLVERTDSGDVPVTLDRRIFIIGSDSTAELEIVGRGIGSYHAEISHNEGTYTLKHQEGEAEVKVNGKPTREHALCDGDVVAIGERWFTFKDPKTS